jgi:membrane protein YqaA with SNARE-associated domain
MSGATRPVDGAASRRSPTWLALVWGFAEATVFFIVPDVLISRVALRDLRGALVASGWALVGSLLGGTVLWFAATHGAVGPLLRGFAYLPGISLDLIAHTGQALYDTGARAILTGGFIGQPYKLFAAHAGAQEMALSSFLAASAAARLLRFAASALLGRLAGRALQNQPVSVMLRLHLLAWAAFYLLYFITMR